MGGLETCRAIRGHSEIAIIMLTVRDNETDKVEALDAGADDYVTKPFKPLRAPRRGPKAVLRRTSARTHRAGRPSQARDGRDDSTSTARQVSQAASRHVRLTPKEFRADSRWYLAAHANKVLSHRELLQAVWGPDYGDEVDALRVVVNQLRKKIEAQPSKPVYLLTEPWVRYRLSLSARCRPSFRDVGGSGGRCRASMVLAGSRRLTGRRGRHHVSLLPSRSSQPDNCRL